MEENIRAVLASGVKPEKLWVTPDCGFFQLPRWLAYQKLRRLVEGTAVVRQELEGQ